jgi:hypothetical protein
VFNSPSPASLNNSKKNYRGADADAAANRLLLYSHGQALQPQAARPMPPIPPGAGYCIRCYMPMLLYTWRIFADGTKHIAVRCAYCHAFNGWAAQTPTNIALANWSSPSGNVGG